MIVTIDGTSGAGKSTQAEILVEHYGFTNINFERTYFELYRACFGTEDHRDRSFSTASMYPVLIALRECVESNADAGVVMEHFWFHSLANSDMAWVASHFGALRMFMRVIGFEPTHSIFLDLSYRESVRRACKRDNVLFPKDKNLESTYYNEVCRCLAEVIPYGYLVDADRDEDAVAASISRNLN